jgi:hypothetical protein
MRYQVLEYRDRTDVILIAGHEQFGFSTVMQRRHITTGNGRGYPNQGCHPRIGGTSQETHSSPK